VSSPICGVCRYRFADTEAAKSRCPNRSKHAEILRSERLNSFDKHLQRRSLFRIFDSVNDILGIHRLERRGRRRAIKQAFVIVVGVGIIATAVAAGYLISESRTEEIAASNIPIGPTHPEEPNSEIPDSDSDPLPVPTAIPTNIPTPTLVPTPTLTFNEIFKPPEKEALEELKRQQSESHSFTTSPTKAPSIFNTPSPTPRPTSTSTTDLIGTYRLFMLDLINQDRSTNGLTAVELGSNTAAQEHAEELFNNGFLGHWGLDGLKPHMRYTMAEDARFASGTPAVTGGS